MKALRWIFPVLLVVSVASAGWLALRLKDVAAENARLRAQLMEVLAKHDAELAAQRDQLSRGMEALRKDAEEVHRLRGEVTTLRAGAKDVEKLRTENTTLREQNKSLQASATQAQAQASMARTKPALPTGVGAEFPKESWQFSGYDTPEAALVSAIWAMQQGNPQAYLDSLSPAEQERMALRWQGMTEQEIAAKHQSDVARISGLKVLGITQDPRTGRTLMTMGITGTDRTDTAALVNVNGQWRFDGFERPAQQ